MPLQAVVGDLGPGRRRRGVGVVLRTDPRIAVERAEADGDLRPVGPGAAEQTRPADGTERLRRPALGMVDPDQFLAVEQPECLSRHAALGEAERTGVLTAPRAMAVV